MARSLLPVDKGEGVLSPRSGFACGLGAIGDSLNKILFDKRNLSLFGTTILVSADLAAVQSGAQNDNQGAPCTLPGASRTRRGAF